MDFVASEFGSAGGVCFGLLRRLQLWVEWNAGRRTQTAWRTLLKWGFRAFSRGFDQSVAGVYVNETLTPPSSGTNPATGERLIRIDS